MKVIYLDVKHFKKPQILDIEDNLETFYQLIECRCIDIVRRRVAGIRCEIICDDEGLLTDEPIISAIDPFGNVGLVGNLIITGPADYEGNLTGLYDFQIERMLKAIQHVHTYKHPDGYPMIIGLE